MKPKKKFGLILVPLALGLAVLVLLTSFSQLTKLRPCGCARAEVEPTGNFNPKEKNAFFNNYQVSYPFDQLAYLPIEKDLAETLVLGVTDQERWLEIDLSQQKLYAWEGNQLTYQFLISSGKPWTPTITGEFRIIFTCLTCHIFSISTVIMEFMVLIGIIISAIK